MTAAAVAIDFIPLSSSYSVEDKKAYHLSIFSSDDAFVKSSNTIDGVGFDGDTITAISAKNVEFRMDFSDDLLHLVCLALAFDTLFTVGCLKLKLHLC